MHPAASIVFFTTFSGTGFGLMVWLGLGLGPSGTAFGFTASALALGLASVGLTASLWHLGNPQRAWRALSQWRSSWLSREGVLALATLAAYGLYAFAWIFGPGRIAWLGVIAAILAAATIYATSMIYASIKAVPRWSKPPTPLLFLAYALAGGALTYLAVLAPFADLSAPALLPALALLLASGAVAVWWTVRAAAIGLDADGSTPETAIGLPGLGRARLFEAPHSAPNYLMREMVFRVARKHAQVLRRIGFGAAFLLPLALVAAVLAAPSLSPLLLLAVPLHLIGAAASRWLFFAEAEHVVSLYYGYR
jgi:sulfite dehydrogenase (quinone) subunit SoeC